jgi:hypothetical protein
MCVVFINCSLHSHHADGATLSQAAADLGICRSPAAADLGICRSPAAAELQQPLKLLFFLLCQHLILLPSRKHMHAQQGLLPWQCRT